jgi:outer membrane protein assembly factor BamB
LASLALAGLLATCPLAAQDQPEDGVVVQPVAPDEVAPDEVAPGLDPDSFYGKESSEGVYVRDSALALEKFALAQRMERLKEWNKSADLYQEVVERYPDRVVPARTGKDGQIVQYTSVTRGVMERLAKWPREGLDVYRARYEPAARSLLDAATAPAAGAGAGRGDLAEMHKVFYRYFVTDAARDAGLRLVDINVERGEFQAAARLADELLKWHPGLSADQRPAVLYRAALAHRLSGDEAKATERLASLRQDHADALGTVRGQEVRLAESLARELQGLAAPPGDAGAAASSADSWTTLGGDASRGRITRAGGRPGARLFSVPLGKPAVRNLPPANRAQLEQVVAADNAAGMTIGVFPVVDRGELYFQDGTRVFARSVESGLALPGWAQTYPGDRDGQYVLPNAVGAPRTHQLALTLTDRAVLGVMGQPDRSLLSVGVPPAGEPRLVSLDRATGRENWLVALSGLELPPDLPEDQQKSIRSLQMSGAPLVVGDSVLVAARRGAQQAQFEDAWVLCFHLASGKYRWGSYVASANVAGAPWGMQAVSGGENAAQLAYANGRVYVLSNLGALAALDAYSGTIVWLNIYERGNGPMGEFDPFNGRGGRGAADMQAQVKPWAYNPVIVKDGHVFALPTEGNHLFVYDANTGEEVRRVTRADFGDAGMLLAVMPDGRVLLANDRQVFSLNWRNYDPDRGAASALAWRSAEFPSMRGRPFVTADFVFVPHAQKLERVDLKNGRNTERYPREHDRTWDDASEGPGNVLVTANHVIIAGASHVHGFTDLALARGRLDREVAAAPNDTGTRLRYAEVMFTAGEHATALAKLDEAVALLGGLASMRPGEGRDRVFNLALTFAQKLAGEMADAAIGPGAPAPKPEAVALLDAMYDRAAAAATAPQQQVHYRVGRARHAERMKDAPTAVRLYQEILSAGDLRPVPLLDEPGGGPTQAGAVAEEAIRNLLAKAGAAVYAPYEQAAARGLAEAQAAADAAADGAASKPDRLLAVAQTYPNASVAPQALLAAADAYEAAGHARPAVQVLRQMYFKYPQSPERARVIESMARNYLALPGRAEVAAARLAQGVALGGDLRLAKAMPLPDGRQLAPGTTFAEALAEVRTYSGQVAAAELPDFGLPVPALRPKAEDRANRRWPLPPAGAEPVIPGVRALAVPLRDFARPDRVVAWSDGGRLSIYAAGSDQPVGTSDAMADVPRGSAWLAEGLLVWHDRAVALVPEAGGNAVWRIDLADLPDVEVVRAGDVPAAAADAAQQQQRPQQLVRGPNGQIFRRNGQAFIVQNGNLRQLNPQPQVPGANRGPADPGAPEQVAEVRPLGDRVLVTTTTGRILSADTAGGRVAWQTRLSDRGFDRVIGNEDFTVVRVSDETTVRLIAMDTVTGQVRGAKPFNSQTGLVPCNMALSPDGTLVYTLPDRLVLRDLYKPWDAREREVTGPQNGTLPFLNAVAPDQLVIAEGRILALAETGNNNLGANKKFVRVHSLETGAPLTLRVPQDGQMVDVQLTADHESWDVSLRVIGSRLYVLNPQTVLCYDLDRPGEFWKGWVDDGDAEMFPNVRDVLFGKNHVVLLSEPGLPQPRRGEYQLLAFGRYPPKSGGTAESGRLDYDPRIIEKEPITQWQAAQGGFYYLTADGKLHFLKA